MNLDQALEYARAVGLSDAHIAVTVQSAADAKRFEQLGDNVPMRHPDLEGQEIAVHPGTVEQYEAAGWRPLAEQGLDKAALSQLAEDGPAAEPAVPADKPKTGKEK